MPRIFASSPGIEAKRQKDADGKRAGSVPLVGLSEELGPAAYEKRSGDRAPSAGPADVAYASGRQMAFPPVKRQGGR